MARSSNGTIINPRNREKIMSLPGNLSLENAKAVRMLTVVVRITDETVTNSEFIIYLANSPELSTYLKLSSKNDGGHQIGGICVTCSGVLNAVMIIQ